MEIFSKKLPQFINDFRDIQTDMTVFCWRGGMRSKTAATVLDLMGIHANRLHGGFRSYRKWVVNFLETASFYPELYVLNGYTGSGKTTILKILSESGHPMIDLEGMAGHRGSVFGQIDLEPNNQKKFDSLLVEKLIQYQHEPYVFIEGESKRIGKVLLPDFLYEKKEASKQIFIDIPIEERVKNILHDYHPWDEPETFLHAFSFIAKRIDPVIAKNIEQALSDRSYAEAVKLLLTHYYDPRYEHAMNHYPDNREITIHAASAQEAAEQIIG